MGGPGRILEERGLFEHIDEVRRFLSVVGVAANIHVKHVGAVCSPVALLALLELGRRGDVNANRI